MLPSDEIAALAKRRLINPFAEKAKIKDYLKAVPEEAIAEVDVKSQFFSVHIAIGNAGAQVRQSALLWQVPADGGGAGKWPRIIWVRTD